MSRIISNIKKILEEIEPSTKFLLSASALVTLATGGYTGRKLYLKCDAHATELVKWVDNYVDTNNKYYETLEKKHINNINMKKRYSNSIQEMLNMKNRNTYYTAFMFSLLQNNDTIEIIVKTSTFVLAGSVLVGVGLALGFHPLGPALGALLGIQFGTPIYYMTVDIQDTIDKYKKADNSMDPSYFKNSHFEIPKYMKHLEDLK